MAEGPLRWNLQEQVKTSNVNNEKSNHGKQHTKHANESDNNANKGQHKKTWNILLMDEILHHLKALN